MSKTLVRVAEFLVVALGADALEAFPEPVLSPLSLACQLGSLAMVRMLVEGARVPVDNNLRHLCEACGSGNLELVRFVEGLGAGLPPWGLESMFISACGSTRAFAVVEYLVLERMGISQVQVSRLLRRTLRRIQDKIDPEGLGIA